MTPRNQVALLVLRALRSAPGAAQGWQNVHDTLTFLVGPVDDLTPLDYSTLADAVFGPEMALDRLSDPALSGAVQDAGRAAPRPAHQRPDRVQRHHRRGIGKQDARLPGRATGSALHLRRHGLGPVDISLCGHVRECRAGCPRGWTWPLASANLQSAYESTGKLRVYPTFANYDAHTQSDALQTLAGLTSADLWMENIYSGWLWAHPASCGAATRPPTQSMMQNRGLAVSGDLQAGLGSYTELKHDTVLYTEGTVGFWRRRGRPFTADRATSNPIHSSSPGSRWLP